MFWPALPLPLAPRSAACPPATAVDARFRVMVPKRASGPRRRGRPAALSAPSTWVTEPPVSGSETLCRAHACSDIHYTWVNVRIALAHQTHACMDAHACKLHSSPQLLVQTKLCRRSQAGSTAALQTSHWRKYKAETAAQKLPGPFCRGSVRSG